MEKNVSGVDLEELLKAREELDRERGVETNPNMYSDYGQNREESSNAESQENLEITNNYYNITNNTSPSGDLENETLDEVLASQEENIKETNNDNELAEKIEEIQETDKTSETESSPSVDGYGVSQENLSKLDIFSAFEVKENAPINEVLPSENVKSEIPEVESGNSDIISGETMHSQSEITLENKMTEEEIDAKLETIENVDELEAMLSDLLTELDEDDDEILDLETNKEDTLVSVEPKTEESVVENSEEASPEVLIKNTLQEEAEDEKKEIDSILTGIDIEPKFDDGVELAEEKAEEPVTSVDRKPLEEDISENILVTKEDSNPLADIDFDKLSGLSSEDEDTDISRVEINIEPDFGAKENAEVLETTSDEIEKQDEIAKEESKLETADEEKEDGLEDLDEKQETTEDSGNLEEELKKADSEEDSDDEESTEESDDAESEESEDADEEKVEDKISEDFIKDLSADDIDSILKRNKEPEVMMSSQTRPKYIENTSSEDDVEVITDYSQLRYILQKQLKETEETDEDEFKKKYSFKEIEDFKFIDEIASDDFKSADKFSYILGKNEKNEMVYGNFKEHHNLAVFGRNDSVVNSFLNSMILSLCLKNNFHDVNFVLLDSDINSPFEVYNKSSYLYFNRIAKTNKEILDTLIEVSKEVDNRYTKLAGLGVKNIDSYNEIAIESKTQTMPYIILVFNNYTSASQATDHDRINACLYQILKYGRITGVYAVVSAKLPIDVNQINYSLSSRISFKSDEVSTYTVGAEGAMYLPSESDAMYYSIASNKTEHVKVANVTDMELDLIIKDLEE